jgi:hypothetical protein
MRTLPKKGHSYDREGLDARLAWVRGLTRRTQTLVPIGRAVCQT